MESIVSERAKGLDSEWLDHVFSYHSPKAGQPEKYEAIRNAGRYLAAAIVANCPPSADRSDAIRKVREAVMTANAAIALEGKA